MVDLFLGKVLVKNNKDRDELDTEREVVLQLQNRILMLFFGSGDCKRSQEFVPTLKDFFKELKDEFYMERSAQVVLLYISLNASEEQQDKFLKELPKRCLFLPFEDLYRKELVVMFEVEDIPTVVVLHPDCSVLSPNAIMEISTLDTNCSQNWQEAAELIDRNFLMNEEYDESIRCQKYKVEDKKKRRKDEDGEVDENDGGGGAWG